MLFHEIYGSYYRVTASILQEAARGTLTQRQLTETIRRQAFSESVLAIPRGLQGGKWHLLRRDLTTPIEAPPAQPLTTLQKRWLKALMLDPRIRLFQPDASGLEDVTPLFTPDMFVWYDRYADGDDFTDPGYIARFRTILSAIEGNRRLFVRHETGRGAVKTLTVAPRYLEYSEKDDRFRLVGAGKRHGSISINLSRMTECRLEEAVETVGPAAADMATLVFELIDRRNALERVLLHFSHFEKETERLDESRYRVKLRYDPQDETELVIRILSFGPVIRVLEPARFVAQLKQRIDRQAALTPDGAGGDPKTD